MWINMVVRRLDEAGLLQYCTECAGQDEQHSISPDGKCAKHRILSHITALEKTTELLGGLFRLDTTRRGNNDGNNRPAAGTSW